MSERAHEHGLMVRAMPDSIAFCPPLIIAEAQVGEIAACFAQALHDTQTWIDAGMPTEINTSTSTSSRPNLRHVLVGFHTLRRTPPPIPRRPPAHQERNSH